ncbi:TetR/AcrR family transcriptional regulator [Mycolicibacterium goodii]|uniref:TetR/AcrR family transcriptional regulator n=1 Tax=Mycolicibacterium goodii TaxID=134601 RepID=UPI001BDBD0D7|nr:TetR/AcrR family transcriptional regulator [Mycolicibacterium goodii]MBU8817977.1 TetR/AcrR family transcriptional regulator [Mycolicibacterium goodii]
MTGPVQRRTQRDRADESARRLAAAAVELINEKGYVKTTAKDIGLRAGYSRAMVAERFGGKDALLEALLDDYESRVTVDAGEQSSGFDRALTPVNGLCRLINDDPMFARAMFIVSFEAMHDNGELRDRIRQWLNRLRAVIRDGIEIGLSDGSVTGNVDPDGLSREALTAGIGYAYWSIMMPEQIDLPSTVLRWRDWVQEVLRPSS